MAVSRGRVRRDGLNQKPDLSQTQWYILGIPAVVLFVMAVLQILSFNEFKDWLNGIRVGWPTFVAVMIIVAELLGALSLTQVNISRSLRFTGLTLGVLVSGFWFIENLQLASSGAAGQLPNSGFFGNFLTQSPGWWSIMEVTILFFWVLYAAELLKTYREY